MSHAITLARPYARAAFALARDHGGLPAWSQALGFAAQAVSDARVAALLGHPKLAHEALVDLISPPGEVDPVFRRFLATLAENRRLPLLPEIAALYEQLRAEAERVVKARVTSATALDAAALDKLKASLKRRFGREVELTTAVDPALIGGAVIDAGEVVIDGSLRTKLARLQSTLAH
ncbi:MAG: F0F1 ATP synthase subunit delta [Rehaibacterium terrae]|mgnify:CR=1 FL=1|uniref:F0F1 ATP synthase subunit delta n=1 Tax=Rehaibacterium terrae TaxID=1341696 RepID=UPI00391ABFD8